MEDGTLGFNVVPHEDEEFNHHLEVCPFPFEFILPSVPVPFWRDDEELDRSREVVDVKKNDMYHLPGPG